MQWLPMRVTIPTPMHSPRQRGIHAAASDRLGGNIKTRVSIRERRRIEMVTEMLHMSLASYIRWCATKVTDELIKQMVKEGYISDDQDR